MYITLFAYLFLLSYYEETAFSACLYSSFTWACMWLLSCNLQTPAKYPFSLTFVCTWASLVAQVGKNPPAMQETWA